MAARDEFRQALIAGDFALVRRMWESFCPGMAQPKTDGEAEIQLHLARTAMASVPVALRAWSHRWLLDNGLPSLLPDRMRPSAEQMVPRVVPSVGFAWGSSHLLMQPAKPIVEGAVHARIEELAADGMLDRDPELVRDEMLLTKNRTVHSLFGRIDALLRESTTP